ncbi:MAG TPA: tetratricopeptide repeat protein [Mucilaginibacter sp.]|jgi:tetratricopeptide (TPR) repeat protein|nr:tetratricopeptide repeat protein [Mucilaginibacter sp.]
MKPHHKLLLILSCSLIGLNVYSQTNDAKTLVSQGVALNDSGKYDQAIAKYNQALKINPRYENAYYEMGYTLFSTGKEKEAIPYLVELIALNPQSAAGFDMLGSIYDDLKEPDKAIEYYKQGIKSNSNYQRLHFNLAIAYYRQGKYLEADTSAVEAIKLDPKHASSQRIYAMTTYKEGKRGRSLLAWCSFLLLEPQSKRSPEAFTYVRSILNYGVKKTGEKSVNITYSPDSGPANLIMPLAIINATENKKGLTTIDSAQLQLESLFKVAHTITDDKEQPFVLNYYSNYFEKLGTSGNMPAFIHYISLSAYRDEDKAWFKEHDKELKDLDKWVTSTERHFE